jgi:hypothetical protein
MTLVVFAKAGIQGGYLPTDAGEPALFWDPPGGKKSGETGLAIIEEELSEVATTAGQGSSLRSMELLLRFRSLHERTLRALRELPPPTNPDLAVVRILLLARSDPDADLAELVRIVKQNTSLPASTANELGALLSQGTTANHIALLEELIRSGANPDVRQCAMRGLRRIKDPASIPFLVEQLDSDDRLVQHLAVITLAEMTGHKGEYAPGIPAFEENPAKYRQLWKQWWADQQARQPK